MGPIFTSAAVWCATIGWLVSHHRVTGVIQR
jgi:hypothetical protein